MGLKTYIAASTLLVAAGLGVAWFAWGGHPAEAATPGAGSHDPLSVSLPGDFGGGGGGGASDGPAVGESPTPAPTDNVAADQEGDTLVANGQFAQALAWAEARLKQDPTADTALLVKAQALAGLNRKPEAVAVLDTLISRNGDGASDAAYQRALLQPADQITTALEAVWRKFGTAHGGMKAAKDWADRRYEDITKSGMGGEGWEDLRDAYSLVLYGHLLATADEKPIVDRLNTLNKFLIYSPGSTMKSPTVTVHTVTSGEALSIIARKYVVPVFRIQRVNDISDPRRIRVGQKLRVITGTSEVFVSKSNFILTVFMDQKFIARYPVGIGKDDQTPEGVFKVITKDWNPDWYYQGHRYPFGDPKNILGVAWLGLNLPSGSASIGIHGSVDGQGVGQKSSLGCIRMRNEDVSAVYDWVTIGSVVHIMP